MIFSGSKRSQTRFSTIHDEFIEKYGNKYDYTDSIYTSFKSPMNVRCKEHGTFEVTPQKHLYGQECPICSDIEKYGHIQISKRNLESHKDLLVKYLHEKYKDYPWDFSDLQISNNAKHRFTFLCKEHGKIQTSSINLSSCKKCKNKNKADSILQTTIKLLNEFLEQRDEEVLSIESNKVILKCEHSELEYNNAQLRAKVVLCSECSDKSYNKISSDEFISRAIERVGDIYDIRNTEYTDARTKIKLQCEKHGAFSILPGNLLKGQGCNKCSHRTSKAETEILDKFPGAIQSDRTTISKELDLLYDNFAIEYNGLMWHSDGNSKSEKFNTFNNKNKHLEKTELCENAGIQLFHIFENEWLNDKDKWCSVIGNKLGISERIFARKCQIKEVSDSDYKQFCIENHLQGYCAAKVKLGLYYNNKLVSIMSFSKPRFNKNAEYELIRLCSRLNTTIIGGASKLLKHFEIQYNPTSIISYANRRWSQGNVYEKLGFDFIKNTPPNYFYFKPNENILYSRNKFQKHKLPKLLNEFDIELTESENMFNNGYRKIFDSGNKVYIKRYK